MAFVACPHCGGQTRLIAEERSQAAPVVVAPMPVPRPPSKFFVTAGLDVVAVLLGITGLALTVEGCSGQLQESMIKEGSAIRQAVGVLQSGFGLLLFATSAIIYALTRIIKK